MHICFRFTVHVENKPVSDLWQSEEILVRHLGKCARSHSLQEVDEIDTTLMSVNLITIKLRPVSLA